jgi:hypothetical protein
MDMSSHPTSTARIDAFHRERSRCLDEFVALEEALTGYLQSLGIRADGMPLGQKQKRFNDHIKTNCSALADYEKFKGIAARCSSSIAIRNDLVHSRLHIVSIDGANCACLINVGQPRTETIESRIVSLIALQALTKLVKENASALRGLTPNPASSPRPPVPGAGGGP